LANEILFGHLTRGGRVKVSLDNNDELKFDYDSTNEAIES